MEMKKKFYTLALGAILLASCSQDETPLAGEAEAVKMTFTANLSSDIHSRAEGETPTVSVDKLICAVCKQTVEGETASLSDILIRDTVDVDATTGKATFTPTLLKGYKYGIVFWAYKSGTNFYDTNNLANITFTPNAGNNQDPNAEGLVAYTKTVKDVSTSSTDLQVTLTRPLAQVNISTTQSDWDIVEKLGETPATSTITLTNCSNVYNALNETYSGGATFTYTISLSNANKLADTEMVLLGTGYTFPGSTVDCSISLKNNAETPAEIYTKKVSFLPTESNHRTNVVPKTTTDENGKEVGGLMTGTVSYEVTISEGYNSTTNKTPEELEEEAKQNQGNNE